MFNFHTFIETMRLNHNIYNIWPTEELSLANDLLCEKSNLLTNATVVDML
jgi:hypothetical protein